MSSGYLVPDSVLSAVLQALHAWSAPGSVLSLSFGTFVESGDRAQLEAAIRSLPDWLGVPDMFSREELESQGGSIAGAFFEH
jgi:hypothetical protein